MANTENMAKMANMAKIGKYISQNLNLPLEFCHWKFPLFYDGKFQWEKFQNCQWQNAIGNATGILPL